MRARLEWVAAFGLVASLSCSTDKPSEPKVVVSKNQSRVVESVPLRFDDDVGVEWVGVNISIPSGNPLGLAEGDMYEWVADAASPIIKIASDTSVHGAFTLSACDAAPWTTTIAVADLADGRVAACVHAGEGWDNPPEYFVHRVVNVGHHHVFCDFVLPWQPTEPIETTLTDGVRVCKSLTLFGVPGGRAKPPPYP